MNRPPLGLDIAKLKFNACLAREGGKLRHRLFPNSTAGFSQLSDWLKQQGVKRVHACMEATGTDFQRRVWDQLLTIPYGETRSYEQMAIAVGDKKAVRAVGRANGLNRIGIVIPCHRVVNKSGELGGYGGGLRRKQYLLDLERAKK